jgi:hypothetical protein
MLQKIPEEELTLLRSKLFGKFGSIVCTASIEQPNRPVDSKSVTITSVRMLRRNRLCAGWCTYSIGLVLGATTFSSGGILGVPLSLLLCFSSLWYVQFESVDSRTCI